MDTSTTFQNYERTEFYHYDHLSGVMTLLVSHGCQKGIHTRCDSGAANMARKFHREQVEGVPVEHRLFEPLSRADYIDRFTSVIDGINRDLIHSMESDNL
jgi:hypothetical protein